VLIIVFGFFFVTVASRIVGLVGSSNSPISGMTIATLMGTCLIFTAVGWSGKLFEPLALVVGGMICIAAANAGGTSQDLKTGYIIGATPRYQQLALFIGAIVSSIAIGLVVMILDTPTEAMKAQGIMHAIGSDLYSAPQATLMATLARGILSFNLDWQFVMVGVFIAVMIELCGIFIGGAIKGYVDYRSEQKNEKKEEDELGKGSLFATGLIAGGALTGVFVAILTVAQPKLMGALNLEHFITGVFGQSVYYLTGVLFFGAMSAWLYLTAIKKDA
jgi:uncharacterized oligopeptide transporter (OPT) family protein